MSDYLHQKGYIYPLGKLSDEENDSIYKKIKGEENFKLDKDKFELEYMGKNDYLIWLTYSTYGEKSDEFGSCRPCNQQEIYYHAPKFRAILGEIDTKKLKFIDFCYYNSTECTVDYYIGEEEYKPMTLTEAMKAELTLASYKDKTPISDNFLVRNGFELQKVQNGIDKEPQQEYIYCNDVIEISAELRDEERGIWRVWINFLDECCPTDLDICTIGQLKMFLAIEGLTEIVK